MSRKPKNAAALASAERNLAEQLPALIDTAVESYRRFALADAPEDAKGYAAQQTACKAALAHLDLLLRLARALLPKSAAAERAPDLETLIAEARAAAGLEEEKAESGEGVGE